MQIQNITNSPAEQYLSNPQLLGEACTSGDIYALQLFMNAGLVNINSRDQQNRFTALHFACEANRVQIVELLLTCPEIDVSLIDGSRWSPLHVASLKAYTKIVELLLKDSRTERNLTGFSWDTPLSLAVEKSNTEVVALLLSDPLIDVNGPPGSTTPLMKACMKSNLEIVELFLNHPYLLPEKECSSGYTAFGFACLHGQTKIVERLLQETPLLDINQGKDIEIPLFWAAYHGYRHRGTNLWA